MSYTPNLGFRMLHALHFHNQTKTNLSQIKLFEMHKSVLKEDLWEEIKNEYRIRYTPTY